MANEQNLKPFVKNDPRINRKGTAKLPDLKAAMADILGEKKDGISALTAIIGKLRQMAANGNTRAAEILLNRGYGLPKQSVELTGKDEQPLFPITQVQIIENTKHTSNEDTQAASQLKSEDKLLGRGQ